MTTVLLPTALISVTELKIPLAPDLLFSPRCRLSEATTSSAVSDLPLLNSTPLRRLKVHTVAPADELHVSAASPRREPSGATSTRLPRVAYPSMTMKVSLHGDGSSESVVDPPAKPSRRWP